MSSNIDPVIHATVVEDPIVQIQIPPHLKPGDTFIYHHTSGPFTVEVPPNATPGGFINVVVPSRVEVMDSAETECSAVTIDRSTLGATVAAGVVGTLLFGALGGLVLAGGAAYVAVSKKDSPLGQTVRHAGDRAVSGTLRAKRWVLRQLQDQPRNQATITNTPSGSELLPSK